MGNPIEEKSLDFAVKIVELYKKISSVHKEYVLTKQLIRSGTSIGANIAESQQAQSKADFISKASISLKEAAETRYWLTLLNRTGYIENSEYQTLSDDCAEIERILTSIIKTTKSAD